MGNGDPITELGKIKLKKVFYVILRTSNFLQAKIKLKDLKNRNHSIIFLNYKDLGDSVEDG